MTTTDKLNSLASEISDKTLDVYSLWQTRIQEIADEFQVEIATGHLSNFWQVRPFPSKEGDEWLCETDTEAENHPAILALHELDEQTEPYGVGPSNMERFTPCNPYDVQAETFLASNGIKFRATLSDSKTAPWGSKSGHHYRVTLSKPSREGTHTRNCVCLGCRLGNKLSTRLTFDFWGSIADQRAGKKTVSAYDVLACISSDVYCPNTFEDFCGEYGYDTASIEALQTFRRCSRFAKRLREFFTTAEIKQLSEIQ